MWSPFFLLCVLSWVLLFVVVAFLEAFASFLDGHARSLEVGVIPGHPVP